MPWCLCKDSLLQIRLIHPLPYTSCLPLIWITLDCLSKKLIAEQTKCVWHQFSSGWFKMFNSCCNLFREVWRERHCCCYSICLLSFGQIFVYLSWDVRHPAFDINNSNFFQIDFVFADNKSNLCVRSVFKRCLRDITITCFRKCNRPKGQWWSSTWSIKKKNQLLRGATTNIL